MKKKEARRSFKWLVMLLKGRLMLMQQVIKSHQLLKRITVITREKKPLLRQLSSVMIKKKKRRMTASLKMEIKMKWMAQR